MAKFDANKFLDESLSKLPSDVESFSKASIASRAPQAAESRGFRGLAADAASVALGVTQWPAQLPKAAGIGEGILSGLGATAIAAPGVLWQKATGGDVKDAWGYSAARALLRHGESSIQKGKEQTEKAQNLYGTAGLPAMISGGELGAETQRAREIQSGAADFATSMLLPAGGAANVAKAGEQGLQTGLRAAWQSAGRGGEMLKGLFKAAQTGTTEGAVGLGTKFAQNLAQRAAAPGLQGAVLRAAGSAAEKGAEGAVYGTLGGAQFGDPLGGATMGAQFGGAISGAVSAYKGAKALKGSLAGKTPLAGAGAKGVVVGAGKPVSTTQKAISSTPAGAWAQSMAKVNPAEAQKFAERHGQTMGDYMVSHGTLKGTVDNTVMANWEKFKQSRAEVDKGLEAIEGRFKHEDLDVMARMVADDAKEVGVTSKGRKDAARWESVAQKAKTQGLTMPEMNELKRQFESTVKMRYGAEPQSKPMEVAKQVDSAVREFQFEKAKEAGFTNLAEKNKETQAYRAIADAVGNKHLRQEANNIVSLTDYIMFAADPKVALAKVLAKHWNIAERFKSATAKAQNLIGRGPGKAPAQPVDFASIQAKNQDLSRLGADVAPSAPVARPTGRAAAFEAATSKENASQHIDDFLASSPQAPKGPQFTPSREKGYEGFGDAQILAETPAITDPHERAAAAMLGNRPAQPMLPYRGTEMQRAPEAAMNKQGVIALPDRPAAAPAAPAEPGFLKVDLTKASAKKKTAAQLQDEIDAINDQLAASHNPGAASALRQKQAALQSELDKLTGTSSVAQGPAFTKKTQTPEEQAKAAAFLGKGKPTTDQSAAAAKHKARMEQLKAEREAAAKTSEQKAQEFRKGLGKKPEGPEGGQLAPVAPEAPKAPQTPAMTMEERIKAAEEIGRKDLESGKPMAFAQSAEARKLLEGLNPDESSIEIMKAWNKGHTPKVDMAKFTKTEPVKEPEAPKTPTEEIHPAIGELNNDPEFRGLYEEELVRSKNAKIANDWTSRVTEEQRTKASLENGDIRKKEADLLESIKTGPAEDLNKLRKRAKVLRAASDGIYGKSGSVVLDDSNRAVTAALDKQARILRAKIVKAETDAFLASGGRRYEGVGVGNTADLDGKKAMLKKFYSLERAADDLPMMANDGAKPVTLGVTDKGQLYYTQPGSKRLHAVLIGDLFEVLATKAEKPVKITTSSNVGLKFTEPMTGTVREVHPWTPKAVGEMLAEHKVASDELAAAIEKRKAALKEYDAAPAGAEKEKALSVVQDATTEQDIAAVKFSQSTKKLEEAQKKTSKQYAQALVDQFGFKNVKLPPSRAGHADGVIAALSSIAQKAGLDVKAVTSGAGLKLEFRSLAREGSRGQFSPTLNNITIDTAGPGTTVHEYGHFLDFLLGKKAGVKNSAGYVSHEGKLNNAAIDALNETLIGKIENGLRESSDIFKQTVKQSSTLYSARPGYFTEPTEIFARGFEKSFSPQTDKMVVGYNNMKQEALDDLRKKFLDALKNL